MWTVLDEKDVYGYTKDILKWSQDLTLSAFPIFCDGIKRAEDVLKWALESFERDNEEILIYLENGRLLAWFHYLFLPSDKQLGICSFFIAEQVEAVLDELLLYLQKNYQGYQWNLYVPSENHALTSYLSKCFSCIDEAFVTIAKYDTCPRKPISNVIKVTKDNFFLVEEYYKHSQEKWYWSPEKILPSLDDWLILLGGGILIAKRHEVMDEIFVLDSEDKETGKILLSTCVVEASKFQKSVYFFADNKEYELAVEVGFEMVTKAKCFEIKIR